jgi:alpha-L-rhamnosidase
MTTRTILALLFFVTSLSVMAQVTIQNLRTENLVNPIGLDAQQPRFSWQLVSTKRNVLQSAYEIKVSTSKGEVWNTGKVMSGQSIAVEYQGPSLLARQKYSWQVRVWDQAGKATPWSEVASWEMGLLQEADWTARWIESGLAEDSVNGPVPMFRKLFSLRKPVKQARAYITAHGVYEAHINGKRVGDAFLTPGWTSYNKRLQYQVYDVTNLLTNGNNVASAMVGSGWYRGPLAWEKNKEIYGKKSGLLFQLEVTYTDGSQETINSDGAWKASVSPIRTSEIYHGEIYDARLEKKGWMNATFNDGDWKTVVEKDEPKKALIATRNEPIRRQETFKPIKIFKTPKGETVADLGQNLVGLVQIKVKGNAGDKITIHHAEVLDKEGNFYTANLRAARAEIIYILKGGEQEVYEPHFTFMGFRYVRIEGFPGQFTADNMVATAFYSDMKPTGTFTCSNPLVNQLQHNIQWGQKGNFLDVPTDCPQRDERLGWTGDAQVFARTAAYNMDVNNFFVKWMKDVAADQLPNGSVPFVVPNVLGEESTGSTGWADAATIIPWNMYLAYGDKRILEEQYASMKAWVDFMQSKSKNDLWNTGFHFGDWLFYRPDDDNDGKAAITDKYLIAQCFYAHSAQLLIHAAEVLNKKEDADKYAELLQKIKTAFLKEYVTKNGRLVSSSQTAYVLALNFDMLPENLRDAAAERLVNNIKDYNYHLTTGFLGTPYLCHVLTRFGYHDVAYTLLMQETYPSWLYPVKMGATTIWERWDGQKPNGTFQRPGMNSFNHYAYGAIGDWMYRVIAGIDTDITKEGVGYKKIIIKPHLSGRVIRAGKNTSEWSQMSGLQKNTDSLSQLKNVSATLLTGYGKVSSQWKVENGSFMLDVEIPANCTAIIYLPTEKIETAKEGGVLISTSPGKNRDIKKDGRNITVEVGSGKYSFSGEL